MARITALLIWAGISFDDDPHQVPLSRFRLHARESFRYEYDFTAHWQVDIRREEILPQDQRVLPVAHVLTAIREKLHLLIPWQPLPAQHFP